MSTIQPSATRPRRPSPMNWAGEGPDRVQVNVVDRDALLDDLETGLMSGRGFTLATLNLDHVVKIGLDAGFRAAYARHSHVTADGNPIVWLSRLAGHDVELVPGSELVEPMIAIAARTGTPVALIGSTQETLTRASETLVVRHPGLKVVARVAPPMGVDPEGSDGDAAIAALRDSGARLCLLALGAPRQEVFAARAADVLTGVGFMSIGAGIDFIAGTQVRAPAVMRRFAAEWLWRLLANPQRLAGRYWGCIRILPKMTMLAVRHRFLSRPAS